MRLHLIHFPLCHSKFTFAAVVVRFTFLHHESKCLAGMLPSDYCSKYRHAFYFIYARVFPLATPWSSVGFRTTVLNCTVKPNTQFSIINLNLLTSRAVSVFFLRNLRNTNFQFGADFIWTLVFCAAIIANFHFRLWRMNGIWNVKQEEENIDTKLSDSDLNWFKVTAR